MDIFMQLIRQFSLIVVMTGLLGCELALGEYPVKKVASPNTLDSHFSNLSNKTRLAITHDAKLRENGMTELFLEGEEYQGHPTRIFALYRNSDNPVSLPSGKSPAIVLVHGGGGTAFEEWVNKWNEAGFAAISIAVEGQTDQRVSDVKAAIKLDKLQWLTHENSGPSRQKIYGDGSRPLSEQWMYHAVSAVIRAKKYLQSKEEVDAKHIGLMGISWGGVIVSTAIGFDQDFNFAIPVYGSGFLSQMANQYGLALDNNLSYLNEWEPGLRIERFNKPSLWLTWRNDVHFSLDGQAKTYELLPEKYTLSIKPEMGHSHKAGWEQPESYFFAKQVVSKKQLGIYSSFAAVASNGEVQVEFSVDLPSSQYTVLQARINYTNDAVHTGQAHWDTAPAIIEQNEPNHRLIRINYDGLPHYVKHWFITLEVAINAPNETSIKPLLFSSKVISS
jgi:dienelactone hydrolase